MKLIIECNLYFIIDFLLKIFLRGRLFDRPEKEQADEQQLPGALSADEYPPFI